MRQTLFRLGLAAIAAIGLATTAAAQAGPPVTAPALPADLKILPNLEGAQGWAGQPWHRPLSYCAGLYSARLAVLAGHKAPAAEVGAIERGRDHYLIEVNYRVATDRKLTSAEAGKIAELQMTKAAELITRFNTAGDEDFPQNSMQCLAVDKVYVPYR